MGPSTCGSLDSYKGLVFATFNPEAPPLRKYLGKVTWYLDVFFDRREGLSLIHISEPTRPY